MRAFKDFKIGSYNGKQVIKFVGETFRTCVIGSTIEINSKTSTVLNFVYAEYDDETEDNRTFLLSNGSLVRICMDPEDADKLAFITVDDKLYEIDNIMANEYGMVIKNDHLMDVQFNIAGTDTFQSSARDITEAILTTKQGAKIRVVFDSENKGFCDKTGEPLF